MHFRALPSFMLALTLVTTTSAFAAPVISADRPIFDFGTVPQGKKVDHVFTLKNKGDTPLTVLRTKTSCGCTVANVSTKTIEPGKSAEIRTTFDSASFSGKITKTITVETNDPATPALTLTVKGMVSEEFTVLPRQVNLGAVKAGTSKEFVLTAENRGDRPVRIVSVTSSMKQSKVVTKKQSLKSGESTQITVTITPQAEDRFLSGFMTIATDIPGKPEINIPLYGSVAK